MKTYSIISNNLLLELVLVGAVFVLYMACRMFSTDLDHDTWYLVGHSVDGLSTTTPMQSATACEHWKAEIATRAKTGTTLTCTLGRDYAKQG